MRDSKDEFEYLDFPRSKHTPKALNSLSEPELFKRRASDGARQPIGLEGILYCAAAGAAIYVAFVLVLIAWGAK